MKLTSPSSVRSVLSDLNVRPSKALGQNFLIDQNILDIIVETAAVGADDSVLEIGPGLGVLTDRLVQDARRVMAVEVDGRLVSFLRERFSAVPSLTILHKDAKGLDFGEVVGAGYNKLVANLPYSVGSRVLMNAVMASILMEHIVVTVQLEVAERMLAKEGSRDYGLLSVWTQLAYDVSMRKTIVGTCFWPAPEVSSAVVELRRKPEADVPCGDREKFQRLTKYAFSQKRKQLRTILRGAPPGLNVTREDADRFLVSVGIDARCRPSDLSVSQWCGLTNVLTVGQ